MREGGCGDHSPDSPRERVSRGPRGLGRARWWRGVAPARVVAVDTRYRVGRYTFARVPALLRIVPACPLCWCRARGGRSAKGAPAASVSIMADPGVPRDVNDLMVEEEMEEDAVVAPTPAERFLASS